MTIARGAVLGALLAVVAVLAIILLSGSGGEQYHLIFQNAGQLVKGDDVQIGGRRVGGVSDILLTDDNQAEVVVSVDKPYAPLHEGTTATIRLTSLSGVANRYIALSPGPNSAPEIPGGGSPRRRADDLRGRPRPALQHARSGDAQGPAAVHPGFRGAVRGPGRERQPVGEVLQPVPVDDRPAREGGRTRPGHADARDRRGRERHRRRRAARAAADLARSRTSTA